MLPLPPMWLLGRPLGLPPSMLSFVPSHDPLSTSSPVLSSASARAPQAALPTALAPGSSRPVPPKARASLHAASSATRAPRSAADDSPPSINFSSKRRMAGLSGIISSRRDNSPIRFVFCFSSNHREESAIAFDMLVKKDPAPGMIASRALSATAARTERPLAPVPATGPITAWEAPAAAGN